MSPIIRNTSKVQSNTHLLRIIMRAYIDISRTIAVHHLLSTLASDLVGLSLAINVRPGGRLNFRTLEVFRKLSDLVD